MLTVKTDKKKIFQYSAVLGIIFLIIIYVVVTNFIMKPGSDSASNSSANSVTSGVIKDVKTLDAGAIQSDKFNSLKENSFKEERIEDLSVGKKDLFSSSRAMGQSTTTQQVSE